MLNCELKSGIYIIKCVVNNKIYIGQSVDLEKRLYNHFWNLRKNRHANSHLQTTFNKYTEDSFVFEILEYCSSKVLDAREKHWIKLLDAKLKGFNMTDGGHATHGWTPTESQRNNISEGVKQAYKKNPELASNISDRQNERFKNPEERDKVSKQHKGKTISDKQKQQISEKAKKQKWTDSQREKFTKARKGKPLSGKGLENIRNREHPRKRKVNIDGVIYHSIAEASRVLGIKPETIQQRLRLPGFPNFRDA